MSATSRISAFELDIRQAGESALIVDLEGTDSVLRLREALLRHPELPTELDIVPGWRSLLVSRVAGRAATTAQLSQLRRLIIEAATQPAQGAVRGTSAAPAEMPFERLAETPVEVPVDIPVVYDGEDLADVAALTGLSPTEVVARHVAPTYVVAFLGFARGFPYLAGLDDALRVPRLATPRVRVPAGSVGIAADQTGVYPMASPGGWRLLGRTDFQVFDADRDPPGRLAPGTRVRFVPRAEEE